MSFSFQTVFYHTRYSYRCCSCAFDHEYLTYLSDSGKINDEIYERIVYSIKNGKCPHAEHVPKEYLKQTGIYGIHIAMAIAQTDKGHIGSIYSHVNGLIFNLRPYDIAVFKRKTSIACLILGNLRRSNKRSLISSQIIACMKRSGVDPNQMTIEKVPRFEAYVDIGDTDILKNIRMYPVDASCLVNALRRTLMYYVPECLECVLQFIGQLATTDEVLSSYIIPCAEAAIIYNKHIVLEQILAITCRSNPPSRSFLELGNISRHEIVSDMRTRLNSVCIVFDRPECRDVLSKYRLFQNINVSSNELITRRLFCHLSFDYFKEEFATVLRHNSHTELNSIQKDLNACLVSPFTSLTLFRALLSAGASVNYLDNFKRTPLLTILMEHIHDHIDVMDKIKLLIDENPDHETHKTAVMRGLWRDSTALQTYYTTVKCGNYIVDAKQHGRYGYDDDDNFCLNFMGPFLMECGFPVSRQSLLDSLNRDLHPFVRAYILKYIESPMPLKVICRDTLRRHFKGRLIHRLAEQSQC